MQNNKLSIKVARFSVLATRLRRAEETRDALWSKAGRRSAFALDLADDAVALAQHDLDEAERELVETMGDELAARRQRLDLQRANRTPEIFAKVTSLAFVVGWVCYMASVVIAS
jgi:hypothetical protein